MALRNRTTALLFVSSDLVYDQTIQLNDEWAVRQAIERMIADLDMA